MRLTQDLLRESVARRIRALRPDLAARYELSTAAGLAAAAEEIARGDDDQVLAVVVIRALALPAWIGQTCRFASHLPPAPAEAWRRAFTRTVFLAGNPSNLRGRFHLDQIAPDDSVAWAGPAPAGASAGLRRLLKVWQGPRGVSGQPPLTIRIPGADPDPGTGRRPVSGSDPGCGSGPEPGRGPVRRRLYLATADVTVADCLVHLNHLLAEAVLDGLVRPADVLSVHQRPRLSGVPEPVAALRVGVERADPERLRAYAALTEPTSED